jgi:hypothetical protein
MKTEEEITRTVLRNLDNVDNYVRDHNGDFPDCPSCGNPYTNKEEHAKTCNWLRMDCQ